MTEAEKAQLFAIRNIVDAMLMGSSVAPDPAPCIHPEREADPLSTLGRPMWRCAVCKARIEDA